MGSELARYYEQRAAEYDEVYAKPERQDDIRRLQNWAGATFTDRRVLEIAAGTGYWTQFIAKNARSILATDYNQAPLRIAAERDYPRENVRFARADAFAPCAATGVCDAAFVGFWWSHMPRADLDRFLAGLGRVLRPNSLVAVVDNRYVEGSSHPVRTSDPAGNTYQFRRLADGTEHRVLKNFPSREELLDAADRHGTNSSVTELDYYWTLTFHT